MRVLLSGSSGLVGSALLAWLGEQGAEVARIVRSNLGGGSDTIFWQPELGILDPAQLEGFELVIHLAGENLASGRWTTARKRRIRDSRVVGTRLLSERLASLSRPPKAFFCASAIGFYGNRGDELLNEASQPGAGFLAEVTQEWESATQAAASKGIRVALLRFGIILSRNGGALAKMLLPFQLGFGGQVGRGDQYWSWIAIDDVIGAIEHILEKESLHGPINLVSPQPLTNLDFTRALGEALHRPTFFAMPAFVARLALGEMAEETLLASTWVEPARLLASGYRFRYQSLEATLAHLIGRK